MSRLKSFRILVLALAASTLPTVASGADLEEYRIGYVHDGARGFAGHEPSAVVRVGRDVLATSPSSEPWSSFAKLYDPRTGRERLHLDPPAVYEGTILFGQGLAAAPAGMLIGDPFLEVVYDVGRPDGQVRGEYRPPAGALPGAFGVAVASVGSGVVVGDPEAGEMQDPNPPFVTVLGPGEAYLYAMRGDAAPRVLQDPAPIPGGHFGAAVARCRDGFAIGRAPFRDAPGAVHIYDRDGELVQTLTAPDAAVGDRFGAALAASGRRLLVGAPSRVADGAVYVFERRQRQWVFVRTLQHPDAVADTRFDRFGTSVALAGRRAAVGGISSVVVFDAERGDVRAILRPPSVDLEDEDQQIAWSGFGASVALAGSAIVVTTTGSGDENGSALVAGFVPASRRQPTCEHRYCPLRDVHGGARLVLHPALGCAVEAVAEEAVLYRE